MPVTKELRGVECVRCREAGHWCQAQIKADDVALCLRCANDEPCIYVTAARFEQPVKVNDDPCMIPALTREDREAVRALPRLPSIHATIGIDGYLKIDPETRAALLEDARTLSAAQVARKYGVAKATVRNLKRSNRQEIRARMNTPVEIQIGGEDVRIAPGAVFGAEMLKARESEPKKKI
jgi:hypothetical protein